MQEKANLKKNLWEKSMYFVSQIFIPLTPVLHILPKVSSDFSMLILFVLYFQLLFGFFVIVRFGLAFLMYHFPLPKRVRSFKGLVCVKWLCILIF